MRALKWIGGILAAVAGAYITAVLLALLPPPNEAAEAMVAWLSPARPPEAALRSS